MYQGDRQRASNCTPLDPVNNDVVLGGAPFGVLYADKIS